MQKKGKEEDLFKAQTCTGHSFEEFVFCFKFFFFLPLLIQQLRLSLDVKTWSRARKGKNFWGEID